MKITRQTLAVVAALAFCACLAEAANARSGHGGGSRSGFLGGGNSGGISHALSGGAMGNTFNHLLSGNNSGGFSHMLSGNSSGRGLFANRNFAGNQILGQNNGRNWRSFMNGNNIANNPSFANNGLANTGFMNGLSNNGITNGFTNNGFANGGMASNGFGGLFNKRRHRRWEEEQQALMNNQGMQPNPYMTQPMAGYMPASYYPSTNNPYMNGYGANPYLNNAGSGYQQPYAPAYGNGLTNNGGTSNGLFGWMRNKRDQVLQGAQGLQGQSLTGTGRSGGRGLFGRRGNPNETGALGGTGTLSSTGSVGGIAGGSSTPQRFFNRQTGRLSGTNENGNNGRGT